MHNDLIDLCPRKNVCIRFNRFERMTSQIYNWWLETATFHYGLGRQYFTSYKYDFLLPDTNKVFCNRRSDLRLVILH